MLQLKRTLNKLDNITHSLIGLNTILILLNSTPSSFFKLEGVEFKDYIKIKKKFKSILFLVYYSKLKIF